MFALTVDQPHSPSNTQQGCAPCPKGFHWIQNDCYERNVTNMYCRLLLTPYFHPTSHSRTDSKEHCTPTYNDILLYREIRHSSTCLPVASFQSLHHFPIVILILSRLPNKPLALRFCLWGPLQGKPAQRFYCVSDDEILSLLFFSKMIWPVLSAFQGPKSRFNE